MLSIKFAKWRWHEMKFSNIFLIIVTVSLAACSTPTFGLKPLYPEKICSTRTEKTCSPWVDSLQPVLRWEAFPSEGMRANAEQISKIRDITYDLNIWLSENDYPSSLIYSRRGLPEPRHKMEEPLLPCTEYFWTVRARFFVDGKERISEWGISAWPWVWRDPSKSYKLISQASANEMVRRLPVVPHPNLYRFVTPFCPQRTLESIPK
ncbi:MAG: hypothetical protein NT055_00745 [Nitrospirae bacterium]|nr:hypothetical protein [Nitrospirota bacterium]